MKKYFDCYVPVTQCNLQCEYCYVRQNDNVSSLKNGFQYSNEHMISALTKDRLGGTCYFNLCGAGETLLDGQVIDFIHCLLKEGHYVSIVTNGTLTNKFQKLTECSPSQCEHLFFKFSLHYLELKRLHLLPIFLANVETVKENGASFSVEITATDELVPYIDEIITWSVKYLGAMPHCTVVRNHKDPDLGILTMYSKDEYCRIWDKFKSSLFDFKVRMLGQKRKEFCYAGSWSYFLDLGTGELRQCYDGNRHWNVFKNIQDEFPSCPIGHECPESYCYNANTFLAFGDIPTINTPSYTSLRDRECVDGSHWLTSTYQEFFSRRLYDYNSLRRE